MCNSDMAEWIRNQMKLAGEELIRRSENFDLGGLDMITDIHIDIFIPTITGQREVPSFDITLSVLNKSAIDDYMRVIDDGA